MSNTYCARSDIEAIFGPSNVSTWADLDDDENATSIANRITASIAAAGDDLDSWFRNTSFTIPLADEDGDSSPFITTLAATYAGVWLYENHGVDREHGLESARARYDNIVQEIRGGLREIDIV